MHLYQCVLYSSWKLCLLVSVETDQYKKRTIRYAGPIHWNSITNELEALMTNSYLPSLEKEKSYCSCSSFGYTTNYGWDSPTQLIVLLFSFTALSRIENISNFSVRNTMQQCGGSQWDGYNLLLTIQRAGLGVQLELWAWVLFWPLYTFIQFI